MTGGAVKTACEAVRTEVLKRVAHDRPGTNPGDLSLLDGKVVSASAVVAGQAQRVLGDEAVELTREFHHRRDHRDGSRDRPREFARQLAFAVHRAVVDVDVELGLVKVVALDSSRTSARS